jgi:uncharacterized membrane protein YdjX (TVP38/TMEM64 family)
MGPTTSTMRVGSTGTAFSGRMKPMRKAQLAALVVAIAVVAVCARLGVFHEFGSPFTIRQDLLELGPLGYAVFIAAFAFLQPFGLPGLAFCAAASLIWPWPIAFALSMTGAMSSTAFGFAFARFVARDYVAKILPPRFKNYDARLAENAFATVFILRIMFLFQPLLHAFFGLSKVRFSTYMIASGLAYALPVLGISYFGQRAVDYLRYAPLGHKIVLGIIVVKVIILGFALLRWLRRREERRLAAQTAAATEKPAS